MSIPATDLPIIVLAAGSSLRMRGADKLMQSVEGRPLILRQVDLASAVTSGPVIVALPVAPHPRHAALAGTRALLVEVPGAAEGMNASLRAAVAALPPDTPAAMVLLGDLPDLTVAHINCVLQAFVDEPDNLIWRGATEAGAPGHPVIFASALFKLLAGLRGDSGGREAVAAAAGRVHLVPLPGDAARRDLDTPEDWAAWRAEQAIKN